MSAGQTLKLEYTCHQCRTRDREIEVPAREPNQDIIDWVSKVRMLVAIDHELLVPYCQCQHVDLKIPLNKDAKFIGEVMKQ